MRADRLLQVATLLRQHGRLSASELARRLEVTPRTIARDIEALSAAGVPVYAERGRAGGYALLPGYRPDPETLDADEAGALFVSGGAEIAGALGMGEEFSRALRKLASAMPEPHLDRVGSLLDLIVIDPGGWGGVAPERPAALASVFAAVQDGCRLRVGYRPRGTSEATERTLDPWGLVLAAGTWYAVAADRGVPHTYRLDRMTEVTILPEPVRRPERLDLRAEWRELRASWNARPTERIVLQVARAQADLVERNLGLVLAGRPSREELDDDVVEIRAEVTTLRGAVGMLLGFGVWVRVVDPPELRDLMVAVAGEVIGLYG